MLSTSFYRNAMPADCHRKIRTWPLCRLNHFYGGRTDRRRAGACIHCNLLKTHRTKTRVWARSDRILTDLSERPKYRFHYGVCPGGFFYPPRSPFIFRLRSTNGCFFCLSYVFILHSRLVFFFFLLMRVTFSNRINLFESSVSSRLLENKNKSPV